MKTNIHMNFMV